MQSEPLTSNGPSAYSVKCFAKALPNRYCLTLTLSKLSGTPDRIIIGKSLKLCAHCFANAPEVLVTSIKIPLLLFLRTLTLVRFCCSYKYLEIVGHLKL